MNRFRFLNSAAMFFGPAGEGSGAAAAGDAGAGGEGGAAGGGEGGEGAAKSHESILFPKENGDGEGDKKSGDADPAGGWKEFVPDPAKSEAENAAAKTAHDATKPAADWKEYENDPKKSDAENAAAKAEHDKTKPAAKDALDIVPPDGKYALTMPEGVEVDQELLDALGPKFASKKMTSREAQELADEFIKVQTAREKKRGEAWGETLTKWVDDAKADKEIGGDKWDGTVKHAQRAVNKLGSPALKEYLEASGGGNHPELIRFMSKVGAMIREDDPAGGGEGGSKPAEPAHVLFPSDAPKGS